MYMGKIGAHIYLIVGVHMDAYFKMEVIYEYSCNRGRKAGKRK